jgi:DNA replication and repair protein RecF
MISHGMELMKKRRWAAELFSECFSPLYAEVSGIEDVSLRYTPSWKGDDEERLGAALAERRGSDLAFGTSMSGPHRDRYIFTRKGAEFSARASTGQRRLLALLLRVAQARLYTRVTGRRPLLLLDDVLLELDGEKRRRFLSVMPAHDQAFYTFLPEEPYEKYRKEDTLVYYVREGALSR